MGRDIRCEEKSGQAWPNEAQGRGSGKWARKGGVRWRLGSGPWVAKIEGVRLAARPPTGQLPANGRWQPAWQAGQPVQTGTCLAKLLVMTSAGLGNVLRMLQKMGWSWGASLAFGQGSERGQTAATDALYGVTYWY